MNAWQNPSPIPPTVTIDGAPILRWPGIGILIFVAILLLWTATYVAQPRTRGIAVTLGKLSPEARRERFGSTQRFVTPIHPMSIRQQPRTMPAECSSSDLQQV